MVTYNCGFNEEAFDFKLIKMSLDGNILWHNEYGGNDYDRCFGMDINSMVKYL